MLETLIYFIGGIGLFLYGMKIMSDGLELSTGSKLKKILEILTTNKLAGVLVGFIVTAIIQSSTATVVMIVGFVRAGLMNLSQAVGVIIGANVGTTTTGLIVALNLHTIAPICIFIGAILILFTKKKKIKHIGMIIAGFGILFLGMRIMSDAMRPISSEPWVIELFRFAENPWIGIAIGFIITAVIQSSTAAMGVLLAASMAGMITDLNQAIFILYGQNLGTCMTVIISSIGSSKITKKAALIHLTYKTIGISIVVAITLLPLGFVGFVQGLSDNISTQLVYAHIIINIFMAMILLPFSNTIVKITEMIIRGEDKEETDEDFEYINQSLIENPSLAVVQSYKEVERHAKLVFENYKLAQSVILEQSKNPDIDMEKLRENEEKVNILTGKLNKYLTKLNTKEIEYSDAKLIATLYRMTMGIERMGNHSVSLIKAYKGLKEQDKRFSDEAMKELSSMFENVEKAFSKAIEIFEKGQYNVKKIVEVEELEAEVDIQNEEYKKNHVERLNAGKCNPIAGVAFIKMLTALERISDYACNIAHAVPKS